MAATYDLTGHALLSAAAAALAPAVLDARTQEAEELLGVHGTAFTGEALADVQLALARQVNRLLTWEQYQGVASMSKAGQSVQFASGGSKPVDAIAARIVRRLLGQAPGPGSSTSIPTIPVWDAR